MNLKTKIGLITAIPLFTGFALVYLVYAIIKRILLLFFNAIGTLDGLSYIVGKAERKLKEKAFLAALSKSDRKTYSR